MPVDQNMSLGNLEKYKPDRLPLENKKLKKCSIVKMSAAVTEKCLLTYECG